MRRGSPVRRATGDPVPGPPGDPTPSGERNPVPAPLVLGAAFVAGSAPFSGLAARVVAGTDLRRVGNGTVSGTGLYAVAGFGPLALAGSLDVAKGALGPLLAGRDRPYVAAASAAVTVVGHNWSPWLGGAGGRGISPALGAMLVLAPEGTVLLLGAMVVGRLARRSGEVVLAGTLGLLPLLAAGRGRRGLATAIAVAVPMLGKRLIGNGRTIGRRTEVLRSRLLYDHDPGGPAG